jgi:hypothetical protein
VPKSISILFLAIAFALSATVSAAAAEAPTREEYVERLETVCKPDALATQRAMKGARADVRTERFKVAAAKFAEAASIFGSTVKTISAVPRPPGDVDRLKQWFTYLKRQESYLRQITTEYRHGHGIKAGRLTARFIHNCNLANNVVLAFGFDYCSFKFSRYG